MNKLIYCILVLFTLSAFADDFEVTDEAFEPTEASEFSDSATSGDPEPAKIMDSRPPDQEVVADELPASEPVTEEPAIAEETPISEEPAEIVELPKSDSPMAPLSPVAVSKTEVSKERHFNPREGHWLSTFAFEGMAYPLDFDFSEATKKKYRFEKEDRGLYGARLGFGREIYLGGGLMTSTRLEGYFLGTLFEKRKAIEENGEELPFSYVRDTGQIFGGDVVQTLSYLFDFSAKNPIMEERSQLVFEPFVEGGIGMAKAYNRKSYEFNASPTLERYKHTIDDSIANVKLGAGFQITSSEGYFLILRVTQNQFIATERNIRTYKQPSGSAGVYDTEKLSNESLGSITMYTLGGGYKF